MFWLQAIPAAIYLLALLVIPESPRYLVVKGRDERARAVLTRLFGAEEADRKVAEIRASLAADHHKPRLSDLIDKSTGRIRPILWTGIGLAVFQQFVGINVVFYYGATCGKRSAFPRMMRCRPTSCRARCRSQPAWRRSRWSTGSDASRCC